MNDRLLVAALSVLALGFVVSTGAFAGGDEAVDGVFLNPADSANGDAYTTIDGDGQIRVELTGLNPQATTTVDDVFTISTTNNRSRVWIDHDAGSNVTFYRSDTGDPVAGSGDRLLLEENETVPIGLRVDAGSEAVVLTQITVRAEIEPTVTASPTPQPTTVAAGPGPSTPEPTPAPTAPPTTTTATTTAAPTTTADPTTTTAPGPTTASGTTTPDTTDTGTTASTTAPSTTAPSTTAPSTTIPPTTTVPPDDESPTATTPTTEPDEASPTATAPPAETTAPPQDQPGTTVDAGVTVSTPDDDGDTEIGGLSPVQLGGAVAALAALALGLFAWGLLGSSAALVIVADAGEGLEVRPQSLTDDWYDARDDGFAFRFAESDPWVEASGDGSVTFERAVTVTNTGSDAARVTVADAESLPGVELSADGVDLVSDGFVLESGASEDLTLGLPSDFDPDGEVTVRFRRNALD